MSDLSRVLQAWIDVHVHMDLFEDALVAELRDIKLQMEDPEYAQAAYTHIIALIASIESDSGVTEESDESE